MNQKNKNIALIIGLLLIGFLSYEFSISNTLEVVDNLKELDKTINKNTSQPEEISKINKEEIYLDSIIQAKRLGDVSLQNNLLNVLNKYAENVGYKIISFQKPHLLKDGNTTITTFGFTLEGDYKSIEKILYILENQYIFGEMTHVNFLKEKDYGKKEEYLQCRVLIQHLQ
ncbi:hypothetical protein APR41_17680 [Salegentibacter salinarum]|uniref:General secretion pathway protein n=1 Tax=Salegentibacter salinarum TaxID=447422 RepID=A0A2N0TVJ1_9FLAO|nr:hypothetical protein [Salegentibacter salinarum]PKD18739.1 hypothetical protein APR41_17680 [Salegentibacter salinarum]SKB98601.1 hypothetical protein SAMN05660903_03639 [Salegentibacter salinarum]